MSSAEVRNLTALVASAWSPSTSHEDLSAAASCVFPNHGPTLTIDDWRKRALISLETAIHVRLAFYLARCMAEITLSSVLSEHLANECSNSGLTKLKAIVWMFAMMGNVVTASGLPDIQSVLEQVSLGCRAMWCTELSCMPGLRL